MEKRLYRSCDNRIIAGIGGGLGEYLDIDPTVIRLIFLIALFSGVGFLAYIFAWILILKTRIARNTGLLGKR